MIAATPAALITSGRHSSIATPTRASSSLLFSLSANTPTAGRYSSDFAVTMTLGTCENNCACFALVCDQSSEISERSSSSSVS